MTFELAVRLEILSARHLGGRPSPEVFVLAALEERWANLRIASPVRTEFAQRGRDQTFYRVEVNDRAEPPQNLTGGRRVRVEIQ